MHSQHNAPRLQLLTLPGPTDVFVHKPARPVGIYTAKHFDIKDNIGPTWYVQSAARTAHLLVTIGQGTWNMQVSTRTLAHFLTADCDSFDRVNAGLQFEDGVALGPSVVFSSVENKRKKCWNNLDEPDIS